YLSLVSHFLRSPLSTLVPYTTLFRSLRLPRTDDPGALDRVHFSLGGRDHTYLGCAATDPTKPKVTNQNIENWSSRKGRLQSMIIDRKSTRLNSSHVSISYAVFCLKKK